ncbi:hypothetical protein K0U83_19110, partial [bacterium]|nr:hypothetical protein [bacterium]
KMSPKDCAYIVERLAIRFMAMVADHERQLAEHRTSFGARTEADAKIIAGLRAEIKQRAKEQDQDHKTIVSLISERDGLRVQVQDMREEIIRVNEAHGRTKVVHDGLLDELAVQRDAFTANVERIRCEGRDALRAEVAALQERLRASIARGDFAQMEVAALKSQTPKHPWTFANCEPCDQPATHDTEAGKAAAEAAVKTDPVAEEIKVWDVVEVYQATGKHTAQNDVGFIGTVGTIHLADRVAHVRSGLGMPHMVDLCDVRKVRKVTT